MSLPFNKVKKELDLFDTMPFGKYQGLTVGRVIQDDPRYLMWLIKNSTQFFINHKTKDTLERAYYLKVCNYQTGKRYREPIDYDMDDVFEQEFIFT